MPSVLYRTSQLIKSFIFGLDWAFNPTHTQSALTALEGFINQKTRLPKFDTVLKENPETASFVDSKEFQDDMQQDWIIAQFKTEYLPKTLGYEYAVFMERLGFSPLQFNLANHIPPKIQNFFRLGIKNHDFVHLLFGLYDEQNGKLDIQDYHEWIFFSWALAKADPSEQRLIKVLLFPTKLKALLTFQLNKHQQAMTIGQKLAQNSVDLNITWLKKYLDKPIDQVRQELGIITLQQVNSD